MKDKILKYKKIIITVLVILCFTIVSILYSMYSGKISSKKDTYSKLTKVYNENNLSKKNGISKPDTIKTDENLNVTEVKNGDSNKNTPSDVIKNSDKDTEKLVEESIIEKKVVEISNILNSGKLSDMLNIYNSNYIKDFQITEKSLEVAFPFKNPVTLSILSIDKDFDGTKRIATVRIDEPSSGNHLIKYFTFFEDGTVAPIQITATLDMDIRTEKNGVKFFISKKIATRGGTVYLLEIENKSDRLYSPKKVVGKNDGVEHNVSLMNLSPRFRDVGVGLKSNLILKVDNTDPSELLIMDNNYKNEEESLNLLSKN